MKSRGHLTFSNLLFFLLFGGGFLTPLHSDIWDDQESLMRDLLIVDYWNRCENERLPVTYNHLLQGGYFSMPSARMGADGEIGMGFSYVPPYHNYNLRCQLMEKLEVTANYRVFRKVKDPVFGHLGFGDFSDKGANIKLSLFSAEDSQYQLPGVAIGMEDFIGTSAFRAYYIVATQVILDYNMEISLGFGTHRIKRFFGGFSWMPFRTSCWNLLKGLSFSLEYDATPYRDERLEPHPRGRIKNSPWNIGLKYRLWDIDLSLAYIRGDAVAFSASTYFNFGHTKGLLPKLDSSLLYKSPVNKEVIGFTRPEDVMIQEIHYALCEQGFDLQKSWFGYECGLKTLRINIMNPTYRSENDVRDRLNALLSALIPDDIEQVIVVLEINEAPLQEYHYRKCTLDDYLNQEIGRFELNTLTAVYEYNPPNYWDGRVIFKKDKCKFNVELYPKTHLLFGSTKGKFKYAIGLSLGLNGFLYDDLFYCCSFGYFAFSNLYDINDFDQLNPSQIINVRTDIINYFKQKSITVDEAYLQKVTNFGNGWFSRCALGLFEQEYGGTAAELLYYPVNSDWAFGFEGAILKKRTVEGVGFTDKIRKLHHFHPTYQRFLGKQFFANLYYDWDCLSLGLKISAGKFLANDYGVRFDVCRYFPSGFRLNFWYTLTNGHDKINGHTYHDAGVYFSIPLDIFYTCYSHARWGYGMSAWLRDVGVKAFTGQELYYLISEQRQ